MKNKIYLAIPYSDIDKELSFKVSNRIAAEYANTGHVVFAPITQGHAIAKDNKLPTTWDFWKKFDTEFIKWCDELVVIKLDGYIDSVGVNTEIEIAKALGKKISYKDV